MKNSERRALGLTGMCPEFMRLEANRNERYDRKRTISCKKCDRSLKTFVMNDLRFVPFFVVVFDALGQKESGCWEFARKGDSIYNCLGQW